MIDLYKFMDEKYIKSFVDGKLYMNSLGYFWDHGFESQRDYYEGVGSLQSSENIIADQMLQKAIVGSVALRFNSFQYCHLECFYIHEYDPEKKQTLRFDKGMRPFGNYVIRIKDIDAFHDRLSSYAKNREDYYYAMPVVYHSRNEIINSTDCFDKMSELSWQKEWRIAYLRKEEKQLLENGETRDGGPYTDPIIVDVGDLSRIVEVYKANYLLSSPINVYRGYKIVDHISQPTSLYNLHAGLNDRGYFRSLFLQRGSVVGPIFTLGR